MTWERSTNGGRTWHQTLVSPRSPLASLDLPEGATHDDGMGNLYRRVGAVHPDGPVTFDPNSPEAGWDPMIDWLASQGLEAHEVRSLTIAPDTLRATAELFVRDDRGMVVIEDHDVKTFTTSWTATSFPPRRVP